MPETVCVTLEQLREIEWAGSENLPTGCCDTPSQVCYVCGNIEGGVHKTFCWIGNAIAQAEKLKDWKPEVRDRVRLRAMTGMVGDIRFKQWDYGVSDWIYRVYIGCVDSGSGSGQWRYIAELMPEEGE